MGIFARGYNFFESPKMKRGHLSIAILRPAFNALYMFQRYQNEHFWPQNIKWNLAKKSQKSNEFLKKSGNFVYNFIPLFYDLLEFRFVRDFTRISLRSILV